MFTVDIFTQDIHVVVPEVLNENCPGGTFPMVTISLNGISNEDKVKKQTKNHQVTSAGYILKHHHDR